jgi:hypothetical protein
MPEGALHMAPETGGGGEIWRNWNRASIRALSGAVVNIVAIDTASGDGSGARSQGLNSRLVHDKIVAGRIPMTDAMSRERRLSSIGADETGNSGAIRRQLQNVAKNIAIGAMDFIEPHPRSFQCATERVSNALSREEVVNESRGITCSIESPREIGIGPIRGFEGKFLGSQAGAQVDEDFHLPVNGLARDCAAHRVIGAGLL